MAIPKEPVLEMEKLGAPLNIAYQREETISAIGIWEFSAPPPQMASISLGPSLLW